MSVSCLWQFYDGCTTARSPASVLPRKIADSPLGLCSFANSASLFGIDDGCPWLNKATIFDDLFGDMADCFRRLHYLLYDTPDQRLEKPPETSTYLYIFGRDGFKHQSSHFFSDREGNADYRFAHEKFITRLVATGPYPKFVGC